MYSKFYNDLHSEWQGRRKGGAQGGPRPPCPFSRGAGGAKVPFYKVYFINVYMWSEPYHLSIVNHLLIILNNNMADSHTSMRSSSYQKYTLKKGNNDEKISKCSLLSLSGNDLLWKGDLDSLKTFVETELQINGRWSTPRGENFKFSNPEFSLKWDGEKGKTITVMQDNDENQLYTTLRSYATFTDVRVDQNLENKAEHVSNVDAEADITPHETSDSRKDSCEKCQV